MLYLFGWVKERKVSGPGLRCYCYRCQKQRDWERWRETEWVSFFTIKTVPFLWKNFLVCAGCRDAIVLDGGKSRLIGSASQHAALAKQLEGHQLASKSDIQKQFLQAQRERSEGSNLDAS